LVGCAEGKAAHLRDRLTLRLLRSIQPRCQLPNDIIYSFTSVDFLGIQRERCHPDLQLRRSNSGQGRKDDTSSRKMTRVFVKKGDKWMLVHANFASDPLPKTVRPRRSKKGAATVCFGGSRSKLSSSMPTIVRRHGIRVEVASVAANLGNILRSAANDVIDLVPSLSDFRDHQSSGFARTGIASNAVRLRRTQTPASVSPTRTWSRCLDSELQHARHRDI
jgi:hypothetical protein